MTPYINRPDYCCHMTQIGRFLVQCGWPEEAHADHGLVYELHAAMSNGPDERLIADHAFMPPEPVAEVRT